MAEMSREEVLARYRHLRAISTRHHTEALNSSPGPPSWSRRATSGSPRARCWPPRASTS